MHPPIGLGAALAGAIMPPIASPTIALGTVGDGAIGAFETLPGALAGAAGVIGVAAVAPPPG